MTYKSFHVMREMCEDCIYRPDSPLDLQKLEDEVRDPHDGFNGYRICHNHNEACCQGFWNAHKDEFQTGQIAQRLNIVVFTEPES